MLLGMNREKPAPLDLPPLYSALMDDSNLNKVAKVHHLLRAGEEPNAPLEKNDGRIHRFYRGWTAAHFAARYVHSKKIFALLKEYGTNFSVRDEGRWTPFRIAHHAHNEEALNYFYSEAFIEICKLISRNDAKLLKGYLASHELKGEWPRVLNRHSRAGLTTLHNALIRSEPNYEIIALLLRYGADPNAKRIASYDSNYRQEKYGLGYSAAHIAMRARVKDSIITLLMAHGCNFAEQDIHGDNAFDVCSDENRKRRIRQKLHRWQNRFLKHLDVATNEPSSSTK